MSALTALAASTVARLSGAPLPRLVGWALVHLLWQGAVVGLAWIGARRLLGRRSPAVRYLLACAVLLCLLLLPIATARSLAGSPRRAAPAIERLEGGTAATPAAAQADDLADKPLAVAIGLAIAAPARLGLSAARHGAEQIAAAVDPLTPFLAAAWLAGALALLARLAIGLRGLRRLARTARPPGSPAWCEAGARLARRLGLRRPVAVAESAAVAVPVVFGWRRPLVLLPPTVLARMSPGEVECLLAHELAHVSRGDFVANLLQCLAEALLFPVPLTWRASRRARLEREHCADDLAIAATGDAVAYARALAELEALRSASPALPLLAGGGSLLERIRRIAAEAGAPPSPGSRPMRAAGSRPVGSAVWRPMGSAGSRPVWPAGVAIGLAAIALAVSVAAAAPAAPASPGGGGTRGLLRLFERSTGSHGMTEDVDSDGNVFVSLRDWRISGRVSFELHGKARFSDDDREVAWLAPGTRLQVSGESGGERRRLEATPGADGRPVYAFTGEAGGRADQAEASGWLAGYLPAILAETTFALPERYARLWHEGGAGAVLDAVAEVRSDVTRRHYLERLAVAPELGRSDLLRLLASAGEMRGSVDLSAVLLAALPRVGDDEEAQLALLGAARSVTGGVERANLLEAVAQAPLSERAHRAALDLAAGIEGRAERRRALEALTSPP